jgi:hypothetical protein
MIIGAWYTLRYQLTNGPKVTIKGLFTVWTTFIGTMIVRILNFILSGVILMLLIYVDSGIVTVLKRIESNAYSLGVLSQDVKTMRDEQESLETVLLLQQNHADGQRRVIDRLSEFTRNAREELRKAHKLNLSQQSNIQNLEGIVEEASTKIEKLQKEVNSLRGL